MKRLTLLSGLAGMALAAAFEPCARHRLLATVLWAAVMPVIAARSEGANAAHPPWVQESEPCIFWEAEAVTFRVLSVAGDSRLTLGYPSERWLEEPDFWSRHIAPDDRRQVLDACHQAVARGLDKLRLEYRALTSHGEKVWVENSLEIVRGPDGRPLRLRGRMAKLPEDGRLPEHLRQSRKMEEMGRLAGGVAHDFNNLLTVIGGHADLLLDGLDAHDGRRSSVEEIRKAADRAATLTRQLLAFSRRRASCKARLNLNAVVEGLGGMLRRLIGENIEFVIVPTPGIGSVLGDPGQIEQVVFNLVVNARDAMPSGGLVAIETGEREVVEGDGTSAVPPGLYITLSVVDDGCGMDAETQLRIFEPFFTTKGEGVGTGLGLATVRDIVRESGGGIEVKSRLGQGTRFRIYFPRAGEDVTAPSAAEPGASAAGGRETILVAEDDENVRALACRILEQRGYHVLAAPSSDEASRLSEDHAGPIQLLLADVVMPQLSGPGLARLLRERRPELKTLLMSGYTREAARLRASVEPGAAFVQKPFTPEMLAAAVRAVLEAG